MHQQIRNTLSSVLYSVVLLFVSCQLNNQEGALQPKVTEQIIIKDTVHKKTSILDSSITYEKVNQVDKKLEKDTKLLKERVFFEEKLRVKIPMYFNEMDTHLVEVKYPRLNSKTAKVFSNEQGDISMILEIKQNPLNQMKLEGLEDDFVKKLSGYEGIILKNTSISKINNKNVLTVEFTSQAYDNQIYNKMFITDIDGVTFMGTINYPVSLMDEWKDPTSQIINSLKIKN